MSTMVVTIFSRESVLSPWYYTLWTQELINYVDVNYHNTGKLNGIIETSLDELTLTITHVFSTVQDLTEWDNDVYLNSIRVLRDDYDTTNNITLVSKTVT